MDMIEDHMQYKQLSEFSETHKEGSGISEFSKPYKTNSGRFSSRHAYTELETDPDNPYTMRQGGESPNSYKQPSKFNETHREESKIS